jgi:cell division protein FtsL
MSLRPSIRSLGVSSARRAIEELPQRSPAPARPDLRVVEGGSQSRLSRVSPQRRLLFVASAMGLVLFAVVAFHVVLSQGQFALERAESQAVEAQNDYERLRLQVAELESPERITTQAEERLGMVPADDVTPVTPTAQNIAPGTRAEQNQDSANNLPDNATDWAEVKPHLSPSAQ